MELYSRVVLIKAKYAVLRQDSGQCFRLRLRKPSVEFAFLVILFMCELQVRSSDIVTPRYGFSGTC